MLLGYDKRRRPLTRRVQMTAEMLQRLCPATGLVITVDVQQCRCRSAIGRARSMHDRVLAMVRHVKNQSVVAQDQRVPGMEGLRVVDASVMPAIVSSNTQARTVMIAEQAVDLVTGRERYTSTQNGAPYERIGPAASHICNGRYKPPTPRIPKESR